MLIGLSGLKLSGKDTTGEYLVEAHGFTRLSFADPLKISGGAVFGITLEDVERTKNDETALITLDIPAADRQSGGRVRVKLTMREYLQRYGTEAHRDVFGKSFWTEQLLLKIAGTQGDIVVTDCRFENETAALKGAGGIIVCIQRPGTEVGDAHASEEQFPDLWDATIQNDGTIEDLHRKLDFLVDTADKGEGFTGDGVGPEGAAGQIA